MLAPSDFQKVRPKISIATSDDRKGNESNERRPSEILDGSTAGRSWKKAPKDSCDYDTTSESLPFASNDKTDKMEYSAMGKSEKKTAKESFENDTVGVEYYEMTKTPRGVCIIFCNNGFGQYTETYNVTQITKLRNIFEWLQFQVYIETGLTAKEIMNVFQNIANGYDIHGNPNSEFQRILRQSSDCFVFCHVCNGFDGGIYGEDQQPVFIKKIVEYLAADRCRHLNGKPKLGFISASRGEKYIPFTGPFRDSPWKEILVEPDFCLHYSTQPGELFRFESISKVDNENFLSVSTCSSCVLWKGFDVICNKFLRRLIINHLLGSVNEVLNKQFVSSSEMGCSLRRRPKPFVAFFHFFICMILKY